jgi:hypothetical protein
MLFAAAGIFEAGHRPSLRSLASADFWWHLRTGLGILHDRVLPHSGLYSQRPELPWTAFSWLYDVTVAIGFHVLDLRILPLLAMTCKFLLAIVMYLLAGGLRGRFWPAVFLSAAAQSILFGMPPLPAYCSALLFALLLLLISHSRVANSVRPLYFLPLLFLVWANLDVQFVIGIFVLLLFVVTTVITQRSARPETAAVDSPPLTTLGAVTAASLLATVLTPYGPAGYRVFFAEITSAANVYFPDFQALRFRSPHDYLLLLLVAAAFLALGMRRSRDPFPILLLLLCAFASFYARRDAWLAVVAALSVLGNALPEIASQPAAAPFPRETAPRAPSYFFLAAALACLLLAAAAVIHLPRGRQAMLAELGNTYPVAAADFIRQHQLSPPLFNSLPWGGFLTWYLPEYPVAIDGRTALYGDDFNIQYAQVMNANTHFSTFPALNQAGTILLEKDSLMGVALATVPGFKVAYSDNVAVVLVREQPQP